MLDRGDCHTCRKYPGRHRAERTDKPQRPWLVCDRCREQATRLRVPVRFTRLEETPPDTDRGL